MEDNAPDIPQPTAEAAAIAPEAQETDVAFNDHHMAQWLPAPAPAVEEATDHDDAYVRMLMSTCADDLRGRPCRHFGGHLEADKFHICKVFKSGRVCELGSVHIARYHGHRKCKFSDDRQCGRPGCWSEVKVAHVLPTCNEVRNGGICTKEGCKLGHDFAERRRYVERKREERAQENALVNNSAG